jgi:hypothetical protein
MNGRRGSGVKMRAGSVAGLVRLADRLGVIVPTS